VANIDVVVGSLSFHEDGVLGKKHSEQIPADRIRINMKKGKLSALQTFPYVTCSLHLPQLDASTQCNYGSGCSVVKSDPLHMGPQSE